MRTITLEEHFATPEFFDGPAHFVKDRAQRIGGRYAQVLDRLCDVGAKRLSEMDAAGIDMQVLSLSAPGVEQMETGDAISMARDTNDYLADAVKKHPTRFAGFAAVPTGAPKQAVEELERRVRQQGFKGAVINGHNRGRYETSVHMIRIICGAYSTGYHDEATASDAVHWVWCASSPTPHTHPVAKASRAAPPARVCDRGCCRPRTSQASSHYRRTPYAYWCRLASDIALLGPSWD